MSPASEESAPHAWKSDAAAAAVDNEANNLRTEGAPQQQVVNGWYANDLATVAIAQNTYIAASNDRNGALIATLLFGLSGWFIIHAAERLIRGSHIQRTET